MLQTRLDMETELISRLMTANNSATFPPARITELISQATKWAGALFFWPALQKARVTTAAKNTQNLNYDYYDYPPDFLTDSIARLYIDGLSYELKTYPTFLDYADKVTDTAQVQDTSKRYFANFGRQYFVWPSYSGTPPTGNLIVWGNIQHPDLPSPSSTTIFSLWDDAGNEAIVKKAFSVGMRRLEASLAAVEEQGAVQNLQIMWKKVTDELQKGQPLDHPFFNVPDLFGQNAGLSSIGSFDVDVFWGK